MTYNIATLDTETYGFALGTAIGEIGVACYKLSSKKRYWEILGQEPLVFEVNLPLLEQLELGLTVEAQAITFHRTNLQAPPTTESFFSSLTESPTPTKVALERLASFVKEHNIQEIWMNHTSFDSGRLHAVAQVVGVKPLWPYRAEKDIATIRDLFQKIPTSSSKVAHRALADALWNAEVLANFGFENRARLEEAHGRS